MPEPRLYRKRSGRIIAGVSGGVAEHLGLPVLWVRLAFVVLTFASFAGAVAYGLLWLFVPQNAHDEAPVSWRERRQSLGLMLVVLGLVALVALTGVIPFSVAGPVGLGLFGAAVVWREADEAQRHRWREGARTGVIGFASQDRRYAAVRITAGASIVALGVVLFLGSFQSSNAWGFALLSVLATLIGAAVLTIPWWMRLVRELDVERATRIRSEERAEIAAHLHDSVLQTLALIQKQSDSPREVGRLARGQERELRDWLYGPGGYGRTPGSGETEVDSAPDAAVGRSLSAQLATCCGEVEDAFAVRAQQVVVGDCAVDEPIAAQLAAAREALVNAAKHAGVQQISVYAEVEPDVVSVYVRDRGNGFDPDQVSADRHGLADSIRGRMERNGGSSRVRTAPGSGTEVQLEMPRSAGS